METIRETRDGGDGHQPKPEFPFEIVPGEVIFNNIVPNEEYRATVELKNKDRKCRRLRVIFPPNSPFTVSELWQSGNGKTSNRKRELTSGQLASGMSVKVDIGICLSNWIDFDDELHVSTEGFHCRIPVRARRKAPVFSGGKNIVNIPRTFAGVQEEASISLRNIGGKSSFWVNVDIEEHLDHFMDGKSRQCDEAVFDVLPRAFVLSEGETQILIVRFKSNESGWFKGRIRIHGEGGYVYYTKLHACADYAAVQLVKIDSEVFHANFFRQTLKSLFLGSNSQISESSTLDVNKILQQVLPAVIQFENVQGKYDVTRKSVVLRNTCQQSLMLEWVLEKVQVEYSYNRFGRTLNDMSIFNIKPQKCILPPQSEFEFIITLDTMHVSKELLAQGRLWSSAKLKLLQVTSECLKAALKEYISGIERIGAGGKYKLYIPLFPFCVEASLNLEKNSAEGQQELVDAQLWSIVLLTKNIVLKPLVVPSALECTLIPNVIHESHFVVPSPQCKRLSFTPRKLSPTISVNLLRNMNAQPNFSANDYVFPAGCHLILVSSATLDRISKKYDVAPGSCPKPFGYISVFLEKDKNKMDIMLCRIRLLVFYSIPFKVNLDISELWRQDADLETEKFFSGPFCSLEHLSKLKIMCRVSQPILRVLGPPTLNLGVVKAHTRKYRAFVVRNDSSISTIARLSVVNTDTHESVGNMGIYKESLFPYHTCSCIYRSPTNKQINVFHSNLLFISDLDYNLKMKQKMGVVDSSGVYNGSNMNDIDGESVEVCAKCMCIDYSKRKNEPFFTDPNNALLEMRSVLGKALVGGGDEFWELEPNSDAFKKEIISDKLIECHLLSACSQHSHCVSGTSKLLLYPSWQLIPAGETRMFVVLLRSSHPETIDTALVLEWLEGPQPTLIHVQADVVLGSISLSTQHIYFNNLFVSVPRVMENGVMATNTSRIPVEVSWDVISASVALAKGNQDLLLPLGNRSYFPSKQKTSLFQHNDRDVRNSEAIENTYEELSIHFEPRCCVIEPGQTFSFSILFLGRIMSPQLISAGACCLKGLIIPNYVLVQASCRDMQLLISVFKQSELCEAVTCVQGSERNKETYALLSHSLLSSENSDGLERGNPPLSCNSTVQQLIAKGIGVWGHINCSATRKAVEHVLLPELVVNITNARKVEGAYIMCQNNCPVRARYTTKSLVYEWQAEKDRRPSDGFPTSNKLGQKNPWTQNINSFVQEVLTHRNYESVENVVANKCHSSLETVILSTPSRVSADNQLKLANSGVSGKLGFKGKEGKMYLRNKNLTSKQQLILAKGNGAAVQLRPYSGCVNAGTATVISADFLSDIPGVYRSTIYLRFSLDFASTKPFQHMVSKTHERSEIVAVIPVIIYSKVPILELVPLQCGIHQGTSEFPPILNLSKVHFDFVDAEEDANLLKESQRNGNKCDNKDRALKIKHYGENPQSHKGEKLSICKSSDDYINKCQQCSLLTEAHDAQLNCRSSSSQQRVNKNTFSPYKRCACRNNISCCIRRHYTGSFSVVTPSSACVKVKWKLYDIRLWYYYKCIKNDLECWRRNLVDFNEELLIESTKFALDANGALSLLAEMTAVMDSHQTGHAYGVTNFGYQKNKSTRQAGHSKYHEESSASTVAKLQEAYIVSVSKAENALMEAVLCGAKLTTPKWYYHLWVTETMNELQTIINTECYAYPCVKELLHVQDNMEPMASLGDERIPSINLPPLEFKNRSGTRSDTILECVKMDIPSEFCLLSLHSPPDDESRAILAAQMVLTEEIRHRVSSRKLFQFSQHMKLESSVYVNENQEAFSALKDAVAGSFTDEADLKSVSEEIAMLTGPIFSRDHLDCSLLDIPHNFSDYADRRISIDIINRVRQWLLNHFVTKTKGQSATSASNTTAGVGYGDHSRFVNIQPSEYVMRPFGTASIKAWLNVCSIANKQHIRAVAEACPLRNFDSGPAVVHHENKHFPHASQHHRTAYKKHAVVLNEDGEAIGNSYSLTKMNENRGKSTLLVDIKTPADMLLLSVESLTIDEEDNHGDSKDCLQGHSRSSTKNIAYFVLNIQGKPYGLNEAVNEVTPLASPCADTSLALSRGAAPSLLAPHLSSPQYPSPFEKSKVRTLPLTNPLEIGNDASLRSSHYDRSYISESFIIKNTSEISIHLRLSVEGQFFRLGEVDMQRSSESERNLKQLVYKCISSGEGYATIPPGERLRVRIEFLEPPTDSFSSSPVSRFIGKFILQYPFNSKIFPLTENALEVSDEPKPLLEVPFARKLIGGLTSILYPHAACEMLLRHRRKNDTESPEKSQIIDLNTIINFNYGECANVAKLTISSGKKGMQSMLHSQVTAKAQAKQEHNGPATDNVNTGTQQHITTDIAKGYISEEIKNQPVSDKIHKQLFDYWPCSFVVDVSSPLVPEHVWNIEAVCRRPCLEFFSSNDCIDHEANEQASENNQYSHPKWGKYLAVEEPLHIDFGSVWIGSRSPALVLLSLRTSNDIDAYWKVEDLPSPNDVILTQIQTMSYSTSQVDARCFKFSVLYGVTRPFKRQRPSNTDYISKPESTDCIRIAFAPQDARKYSQMFVIQVSNGMKHYLRLEGTGSSDEHNEISYTNYLVPCRNNNTSSCQV